MLKAILRLNSPFLKVRPNQYICRTSKKTPNDQLIWYDIYQSKVFKRFPNIQLYCVSFVIEFSNAHLDIRKLVVLFFC